MPRVIAVDPRAPAATAIAEAVRVLRAGGLVGLPTETVYGLGARARDDRAVARIFQAKGRPVHHPLIAHVSDAAQASQLAARWSERAAMLARAFWPGPLTLVVERAPDWPATMSGGGSSIALRAPSHPVANAVITALGEPVAAPSANRFQGLSPTTAAHVVRELGDVVDLILDAGACEAGIESTVVDLRGAVAHVLRPGAVGIADLRALLPDIDARGEDAAGAEDRASPGMDARHYAPRARLLVADSFDTALVLAGQLASERKRVGVVVRVPGAVSSGRLLRCLPDDPAGYGRMLYAALHAIDEAGADAVVVQGVPGDEAWSAIADRLRRASQPK